MIQPSMTVHSSGEQNSRRQLLIGTDLENESRSLGISKIEFKVLQGGENGVLVLENKFHSPGGPARHLHYEQDEWFYVLEGDFAFEIGGDAFTLQSGDSVLGPRMVPHVWAFTGNSIGRILVEFFPAGKMESFFREVTKAGAMPPEDPALWKDHGMELLGPPLLTG
jgi:mannose-6-phosphate isomerase-like protein (cupin superfamily)